MKFDYEKVKSPEYYQENRMKAHSDHRFYSGLERAQEKEEDFKLSLNGLWKFSYAKNYDSTIKDFEKEEYNCKSWDEITVPAHIQLEGFDKPMYSNIPYPWEGHEKVKPGEIPKEFNPVGSYVKYITIPEVWDGQSVFISFQGVESAMALWCNGQYVGYSTDSFTASEFDLTAYLKKGENKLAVQVFKWTSASWLEDQDFFRFSGIFRDVFLYTVPVTHVYDLEIRQKLSEDFNKAEVSLKLELTGRTNGSVELHLNGQNQKTVCGQTVKIESENVQVTLEVEKPILWSAEKPYLYELMIVLKDTLGEMLEVIPYKVGLRKFEIKDNIMHLNGKRIVFHGVNRHEFSCDNGRVVSDEETIKDIITMKQNNINAIRTCHYPDSQSLYELCDEYGLYLIAEANLETHGTWQHYEQGLTGFDEILPCDKPEWHDIVIDRANNLYQAEKNHPSILIWSCGNESFGGKNIYEMSEFFRKNDPDRLVHYEGIAHDRRYNDTSDMESQMYPPVTAIEAFLAENKSKPFICCEFTHSMGNSNGAMSKYTDLADREPLYQGGFIWDYIDQAIRRKDRFGNYELAYGGDFDDRPCDYEFSGNGIAKGDRDPYPKMQEVKFNYRSIRVELERNRMLVKNRNLFTNTMEYDCVIRVDRDGKQLRKLTMETNVEPLSEAYYNLPLPEETHVGEYCITVSFVLKEDTVWAKKGHEVSFEQVIYEITQNKAEYFPKLSYGSLRVTESNNAIGVKGDNFEALFSILIGGMTSYVYGGKEMLKGILKPNFWRAPTSNDAGNQMPARYGQWKLASMYLNHIAGDYYGSVIRPIVIKKEETVLITYTYNLPTMPKASCELSYEVFTDGTIKTKLSYDPVNQLGDMPEFGVIFKLDADYDHLEWYGNGPEETYWDRQKGAKLGIYRNQVQDNMIKYLVPQECGNKTEVRYAKVMNHRGRGMIFTGDKMNFSALPYSPHELENAMHHNELPPVNYTFVRVSLQQMGIAGDDSWGARTHEEFLINVEKKIEFSFSFKGFV